MHEEGLSMSAEVGATKRTESGLAEHLCAHPGCTKWRAAGDFHDMRLTETSIEEESACLERSEPSLSRRSANCSTRGIASISGAWNAAAAEPDSPIRG
jgi:hypothetical protein